MKLAFLFTAMVCSLCNFAQVTPLESKVYLWPVTPVTKEKIIFNGSGAILAKHSIAGFEIAGGKKINYSNKENESFFIVKEGPVSITLNGTQTVLNRGSVITVMPGDKVLIENTGEQTARLYKMLYQSQQPADAERGKKAGGSFLINWNDVTFKAHDKGGVRQFFDRQTAMLNRFDIHVTQLNPGNKSHDPHTHKNEEIILMLDGNAEMQIGTDHQKANPGDVVFLNSMVLHNLTNVGTVPCLYFAIQWN